MKKALVVFLILFAGACVCAFVYFGGFDKAGAGEKRVEVGVRRKAEAGKVAKKRADEGAGDMGGLSKADEAKKAGCVCAEGMSCVLPGEFVMGCTPGDGDCFVSERPSKVVRLSGAFCVDRREVSQDEYKKEIEKEPSVFKKCGGDCPVENVTWNDALEFCGKVGKRLPTEAEWEFAARGGEPGRFYGGGEQRIFWSAAPGLDDAGWYGGNADVRYDGAGECPSVSKSKKARKRKCGPHGVGKLKANGYGLYDMLGNVWEWVEDCYDSRWYAKMPGVDPVNMREGCESHVIRGGSWQDMPVYLRVSYRFRRDYEKGDGAIGFRCAMDAGGDAK